MPLTKIGTFPCPVCGEVLGPWSRGITFHARSHGLSIEDLWLRTKGLTEKPNCACCHECDQKTAWHGWKIGFQQYVRGHVPKELVERRTEKRLKSLADGKHTHWTRRPENKPILEATGGKVAASLREKFKTGAIVHWARDKTAATHPGIRARQSKLQGNKFRRYSATKLASLITGTLDGRFYLLTPDTDLGDRINNRDSEVEIQCTRCGRHITLSAYNLIRKTQQRCPACDRWSSTFEEEVAAWVRSLAPDVSQRSVIGGKEIDVLVAPAKLGIECHGLYWHSTAIQHNKHHHQEKSDACSKAGISLVQIFEDEWRDRRPIVESMIRSRLGKNVFKFMARKCDVVQLSIAERRAFFDANHLEGDVASNVAFGLKYDNKLISALSLRKPFKRNHGNVIEIARFASLLGTTTVGGFSRLVKHASVWCREVGFETIMSYVDMRIGDGHSYELAGFHLDHVTAPRFWWTDRVHRFNRLHVRAQLGQTEKKNAEELGVYRIYGCANKVYSLCCGCHSSECDAIKGFPHHHGVGDSEYCSGKQNVLDGLLDTVK